jgi:predicted nucleic acid-binding Zn ribbon protein
VKRLAPRPLRQALEAVTRDAEPVGVLAGAQRLWPEIAGAAVAAETEPVGVREGVLTVRCESAIWAQELELLGPDIRARLNAALGPADAVRELRFTLAGNAASRPRRRNP